MTRQVSGTALAGIVLLAITVACDRASTPSGPLAPGQLSAAASATGEGRGCTTASLRGTYGFYKTGTTAAASFAAVGLATYDGAGNWVATQTMSRAGVFTRDVTSAGRYELSADCGGRLFSGDQEVGRLALADRGRQVFTLSTIPGETVRGVAAKVGRRGCSNATVDGTYGFYRAGTTPTGPLAAVGIATYDGAGQSAATQTISRNGTIVQAAPIAAPYEVSGNCAGRLLTADGQEFARFVVVEQGNEIFQISLAAGNAVTGVQRRLNRGDGRSDDH